MARSRTLPEAAALIERVTNAEGPHVLREILEHPQAGDAVLAHVAKKLSTIEARLALLHDPRSGSRVLTALTAIAVRKPRDSELVRALISMPRMSDTNLRNLAKGSTDLDERRILLEHPNAANLTFAVLRETTIAERLLIAHGPSTNALILDLIGAQAKTEAEYFAVLSHPNAGEATIGRIAATTRRTENLLAAARHSATAAATLRDMRRRTNARAIHAAIEQHPHFTCD